MKKNLIYWQIFHQILAFPYYSLEKAYKASKRIQKIKKDYFLYKNMLFSSKRSWQSILFYINTELNNSVFYIYWSLLEYRFSLCFIQFFQFFCFQNKKKKLNLNLINANGKKKKNKINRKLTWIQATLNDLEIWKRYYLFSSFLSIDKKEENNFSFLQMKNSRAIAYESIGLVPRSITRTFSRFRAELTNQSSSLVLKEFRLAKYQALASLQYIGCLFFIPLGVSLFFQKCFLEVWIQNWWNIYQSQIFLTSFQEEKALKRLQEVEELFWLDKVMTYSSNKIQSQDLTKEIHQQTIELVQIYNNDSIKIVLHLLTDLICFITLSSLFILGKERLVILNSWAQELFYSLSDTMKAFFILLLTDLCIGFHSPHGWEIVISSCLEHFGFVHNKHVISCFVSTFPVILDTVFKYLIFRHLNRISPSIVATYHTMNE
uniref:Potassium/proton antiporter CemA n=1 Tax=Conocephalum conicum TaxID=41839 RepID=A0A8F8X7Z4_CONCI|nr:chloroplast envelope membrane protein [Conocephalum conicum]QYB18752.1 chloroplast envelope membrane protein [Conocephalum conicum]